MDKPDSQNLDILQKRPEPEPKKKIQKAEKNFNIQILIKTLNQSLNSTGDKVATSSAAKTFTASAGTASTGLNKASDSGVVTNNSSPATLSPSQSSAVILHPDDQVLLRGLFRCGDHTNVNIHLTEIQCCNEKCPIHNLISKQPLTLDDHFAEIGIGTVEDISAESSTINTTKMTNQTVQNKEPELPEGQFEPEQYQGDDGDATDAHENFLKVELVEHAANFEHLHKVPGVPAHTNSCSSSEESSQSLGLTEPMPAPAPALPPLAAPAAAALKTTSSTGTVTASTSASNSNDYVSRFATLEREEKLPMMLRHQKFYLQDRAAGTEASFGLKSKQKQISSQEPKPKYKYATIQILEADELNAKAKMNEIVSNKSEDTTATTKSTVERKHSFQCSNNIVSSVSTSTTSTTGRGFSVESDGVAAGADFDFNTSSGSSKASSSNSASTSTLTQLTTKRKRSTTKDNLDDNNDNDDNEKITRATRVKNYDSYFDAVVNSNNNNTKRIITCKLCKMTIPDITGVEVSKMVHIKKHFYPELFHCSLCKTDYKSRSSLERHCRLSPAHAINLKSKKEAKKKQKQKKNVETSFRFRT